MLCRQTNKETNKVSGRHVRRSGGRCSEETTDQAFVAVGNIHLKASLLCKRHKNTNFKKDTEKTQVVIVLLGAPGIATSNNKLVTKGIASSNKCLTSSNKGASSNVIDSFFPSDSSSCTAPGDASRRPATACRVCRPTRPDWRSRRSPCHPW